MFLTLLQAERLRIGGAREGAEERNSKEREGKGKEKENDDDRQRGEIINIEKGRRATAEGRKGRKGREQVNQRENLTK